MLGKQPFSDRPILDLTKVAIQSKTLDSSKLSSSKGEFIRFYSFLKFARDTLANQPTKGYRYENYYESHVSDLLFILRIFKGDPVINNILPEALSQIWNKAFIPWLISPGY